MGDILVIKKHCVLCGSEMWLDELNREWRCTKAGCVKYMPKTSESVKVQEKYPEAKPKKTTTKRTTKKAE